MAVISASFGQEGSASGFQPAIAARAAVLLNPQSGEILFAKEPHLRLPPASTTKVLTALVVLERLNLNARVWVSPQAASAPPSRIGLRAGEAALTQDLLYGLMLKSGNDAAETLAEAAGGSVSGFAELMNNRAWQVGARDSHFMNPHGLPNDEHYTTAYDLALIFRQAMNHPLFADIVRTRSAALRIDSGRGFYDDWRMVPVRNTNRLLASYEGAQGGKTGFTIKARRCFVGEVDRGGVRLITAILNSPNSGTLWQDARTLFDYGFARYGLAPPPMQQPEPVMVRYAPPAPAARRVATVQRAGKSARVSAVHLDSRSVRRVKSADRTQTVVEPPPVVASSKKPPRKADLRMAAKPVRGGKPSAATPGRADSKRPPAKVARTDQSGPAKPQKPKRRI